ncbi:MAG: hypothetical protein J5857_11605 [Treponema sp.]|nr:hypothetical protein [Treponema sp.]
MGFDIFTFIQPALRTAYPIPIHSRQIRTALLKTVFTSPRYIPQAIKDMASTSNNSPETKITLFDLNFLPINIMF